MSTDWLRWLIAAAMAGVVLFHVVRLRSRSHRRDADLTHAAMGVVMSVMLIGVLAPSDSRRLALAFAAPLLWFVWRGMYGYVMDGVRALGPPIRLVVGCAAMVYMLAVPSTATPSMSRMTMSAGSPTVVGALLVATLGVAAWTVTRPATVGLPRTPALAAGCQLAMNAATVYMLMAM